MNVKRISLAAAMLMVLSAAPVLAGQAMDDVRTTPDPARAEQLRQEAEALFSQPKQWRKAARLMERSAELREANDPLAYDCLLYAGRIRAATGDLSGARAALEKAAEQAMARGSIIDAANAFIDAAHVSVELNDVNAARALMNRATLLTDSPLLSFEQRSLLLARLSV